MRIIQVEKCAYKVCPCRIDGGWCGHPKWLRAKDIDDAEFINGFPKWCPLQKIPKIRKAAE